MKVLLTMENCPACELAKESMKNEISEGKINLLDVNTDIGKEIVKRLGVKTVPKIIEVA